MKNPEELYRDTIANEPAYPVNEETTDRIDEGVVIYSGLTKREHFAGLALRGLLSKEGFYERILHEGGNTTERELIA